MTLTELQTALKRYGFDDNDPLTVWINAALHELELAYEWPFLEKQSTIAITAGNDSVTLPADFLKLRYAKLYGEVFPLEELSIDDYNTYVQDQETDTGIPENYILVGSNVMTLWPIPDVAYTLTLTYRATLTELSTGSDVPAIPTSLHYPIVQKAAAIGLSAENEEDRAATENNSFNSAVAQAMIILGKKSKSPRTVQDKQGYNFS